MTSRHDLDRRDLLKWAGFSLAALGLPGCGRAPEREAVPFLEKPEEVTPGISTWYATLCGACPAGCGLLARYRDGRPVKLEGSPEHPLSRGGTCAAGQAHVLSLYDRLRHRAPLVDGTPSDWATLDRRVQDGLEAARSGGREVRLLTGTVNGPTMRAAIEAFLARHPGARHVAYDPVSAAAALDAHQRLFGRRVLPRVHLDRARLVVGVDADFLGTWRSPVELTRGWAAARALEGGAEDFARHVQIESRLSLTGCAADERHAIAPSARGATLAALAARVAAGLAVPAPVPATSAPRLPDAVLDRLARALLAAPRGRAVVLCGANRLADQTVVAWINHALGAYGTDEEPAVLDLRRPSHQQAGDDAALAALLADMEAGRVGALVVGGVNPLYDLPDPQRVRAAFARVPLLVSTAASPDETSSIAHLVAPDHHPLESWGDAESVEGLVTVAQPTVRALGDTRALAESLQAWTGEAIPAYDLVRRTWRERVFPRREGGPGAFEAWWAHAVHDGFARVAPRPDAGADARTLDVAGIVPPAPAGAGAEGELEVVLYTKVGPGDGRHAHNPWLQELPDPVSKVSWDNYAVLAPAAAAARGLGTGDVVEVAAGEAAIRVPVLVQPGQSEEAVAVALGYGRAGTDRFAGVGPSWIEGRPTVVPGGVVGANAAPLVARDGPYRTLDGGTARLRATGARRALASSQLHHRLEEPAHLARPHDGPRPIAQETSLAAWRVDPAAGGHHPHPARRLWDDDHPYEGHRWAMTVDLSRCTGCSACVIACQAENNVPVVGQDEMRRQRDMHWIRIDRYFQGEGPDAVAIHQPMLCQQCGNAPCETVCPVLATVHSSEGLNQQVYNRCVGTRYCSNNCPYKVRRFNWFDYPHEDRLENMVLNPDVTVRTRGVMEKCSFCVQRIQEAKLEARRQGRPLADGDAVPACMQTCPAQAIVFGDANDAASRVAAQRADPRGFRVLEDLGVEPMVTYLRRVRDRDTEVGHA